ncbi:hypothetical protein ACS5PJ_09440 [Pseudarthrobacter sp. YS3]|uniref:hypothetical protein n=1 Tax=Pseudarthrobacter sp. YS3 TaxID=3453718 RepID=UPI003EEAB401
MDFPLSSSVILVVAVVLWIVWVAPYILRTRRQPVQAAADYLAEVPAFESDPRAGKVLNVTAQQENAMEIRKTPETATEPSGNAKPGEFRIRYGRTGIALVAVAALLTAFVSGLLLIFGLGSAILPLSCVAITVSALVLLRFLAVRDRKARLNAAFRAAMSAPQRRQGPASPAAAVQGPAAVQRESRLFDAEAHQPAPKPLTAVELRAAALAVAVAAGDTSATAAPQTAPADTTWEPVDVPKPVYVEAAKAERPAPAPLDLPEAPKAAGKPSLKQGTPVAAPEAAPARPLTKAQSALSNLDDVLQRRRA